ncbi:MAG: hemerythrin domain-containing protein [Clostridium sp.]|nr:hemerythrin domain-containing protein [Clostridium sp.]
MKYTPSDKMISLIADDYRLIQVMSRFGIRMGFGDKSVAEVCEDCGVDCRTFITIVNFVASGHSHLDASVDISLESLMHYLRQSHVYFLEYFLPTVRRKLLDGIKLRTSDVSFLILKFFDEYTTEVEHHMDFEEKTIFVYVNALLNGEPTEKFQIATYSDNHDQVCSKLKELKNIIIKYCPQDADANLLNAALYDIYRCEEELESHSHVEDFLLVPAIRRLESKFDSAAECTVDAVKID